MQIKNKKGQGSVEAALLSFSLVIVVQGVLILFWIFTNFLWIEHQLYQGLICRAEKKPLQLCKTKVLKNIKKLNKTGVFIDFKISSFNNQWKGTMKWRFYKWVFPIKSSLNLKKL